ncbi:hypothetical protein GCM10025768_25180 [Microbacterium pseudoresistens]|uniref:Phosphatidate cytidylyltransferase n=1 Tax=Microbacterium pseudoresistens TaxID=640634 RepID=A0A7Y9EWI5_9MICO|nr:phosphatidate cytidylyltransferase [Microbacterium pseudoresistens]NYD55273.1 phosphatidate cytidylyltransferase [Microbacterium pseudoresistens]
MTKEPGERPSGPESTSLQEQWKAARSEVRTHVEHARGQLDQANERIKERTGRDLIIAIVIGVAIGVALVASLVFVKWAFVIFAVAAAVLGIFELVLALRVGGRRIDLWPQLVVGVALVAAGYFAEPWLCWVMLFVAVAVVVVWRFVAQMVARDGRRYGDVLADAMASGFVQVYVPFLAATALLLLRQERGEWWVLSFVVVVVAADTCAYAAGLLFGRGGRHPMAPRISPKKTWEGFAGGVVGSLLAGLFLGMYVLQVPWWAGLIFGAVLVASATLGDLGESMLKRDLGIKDMSSWLPGHGGLLDRLDSILPSAVLALALFHLLSPLAVS